MDLSPLRTFALQASVDSAKLDLELVCQSCGSHLCDAEPGDTLDVLSGVALDHHC